MNAEPANGARRRSRGTEPAPVARQEQTLPHDRSMEASILGGVLVHDGVLAELEDLETEDFYLHQHRVVWDAIRNLQHAGKPVDVSMLEHEIAKRGMLDAIGGVAFLGELALKVPTVENVKHYRDAVVLLSKNRKTILELSNALQRAYSWPHDPSELVSEVMGQLARFEQVDSGKSTAERARWCVDFSTFLGDAEPDDDDAIDWVIRDIIPRGENALFGGPMKAGKTWAAMDLMLSVALGESWLGKFENTLGQPANVLGVLLEDNTRRIRKRVWELCRARNTTPNDARIREHMKISRSPLRLPDAKDQRRFINELKQWKPALVVVDNLTRVLVGDPNSTRDAAAFARAWTEIAEETGACIMFLHHTRKASGGEQKGQIDPFDTLRGSGDFGAAARNILVTTPLRTETELLAEVRMRGNLDLRRDGFVLGFERTQATTRWQAKLVDRGEIQSVKEAVHQQNKAAKREKKRLEAASVYQQRRNTAIEIARRERSVSGARLARELGLDSPRGVPAVVLAELERDGLLVRHHKLGYVLVAEHEQTEIRGVQ